MPEDDTRGRPPSNLEAVRQRQRARAELRRLGVELEAQLRAHFPEQEQYRAFVETPAIAHVHNGLKLGTISLEDMERFVQQQQLREEFFQDMPARDAGAKQQDDSNVVALSRKKGLSDASKNAFYDSIEQWKQGFKLVEQVLVDAVPLIDDTPQRTR